MDTQITVTARAMDVPAFVAETYEKYYRVTVTKNWVDHFASKFHGIWATDDQMLEMVMFKLGAKILAKPKKPNPCIPMDLEWFYPDDPTSTEYRRLAVRWQKPTSEIETFDFGKWIVMAGMYTAEDMTKPFWDGLDCLEEFISHWSFERRHDGHDVNTMNTADVTWIREPHEPKIQWNWKEHE